MADETKLEQVMAFSTYRNYMHLAAAFEIILGVPPLQETIDEVDWGKVDPLGLKGMEDNASVAVDALRDQAWATAYAIAKYVQEQHNDDGIYDQEAL